MAGAMWTTLAYAAVTLLLSIGMYANAKAVRKSALDSRDEVKALKAARDEGGADNMIAISMLSFMALGILFAIREFLQ